MVGQNPWASWYASTKGKIDSDIPKIEEIFRYNSVRKILDLGCGIGRHTIYFVGKGFETYGLDQSSDAIGTLRNDLEKMKLHSELQVKDMTLGLPYKNNFFDAVISIRAMHHTYLEKIRKIVSEIERVTRPKGCIYIQVPTYDKLLKLKQAGESFQETEPGTNISTSGPEKGVVHHNFTKEELIDLFKNFEIKELYEKDDHYCMIGNKK